MNRFSKARSHRHKTAGLLGVLFLALNGGLALGDVLFVAAEQGMWRLEDLNGDRSARSPGELIVFRDGSGLGPDTGSGFTDVAAGTSGVVYGLEPAGNRVIAMEDLNADNDAQDAGETTVWYDGAQREKAMDALSIATTYYYDSDAEEIKDVVYLFDTARFVILKLVDLDGDGVISGPPEISDFHALSTTMPFTACRIHADQLGRLYGTLINRDEVARLWNGNLDGIITNTEGDLCPVDQHIGEFRSLASDTQALFELFGVAGDQSRGLFVTVPPSQFRATGAILGLTDRNQNDAIDPPELTTYAELGCRRGRRQVRLENPTDVSIDGQQAAYVADSMLGVVLWFRDTNGDGAAMDRRECGVFARGIPGALGLAHAFAAEPVTLSVVTGATDSDEKGLQMDVPPAAGTLIEVAVTNRDTGLPVPGAPVRCDFFAGCFLCNPREGQTDSSGLFRLLISASTNPANEAGSFTLATAGNERVFIEIIDLP